MKIERGLRSPLPSLEGVGVGNPYHIKYLSSTSNESVVCLVLINATISSVEDYKAHKNEIVIIWHSFCLTNIDNKWIFKFYELRCQTKKTIQ
jgi:hypothetical protein